MKIVNHSIIGSGLSSLIKFQLDPSSLVYSSNEKKISKKLRFYENLNIGGNTNNWGGYINHKIYKSLLKNPKFNTFSKNQRLYKLRKLFCNPEFNNTYFISEYSNKKILRINKKHFKNSLVAKKIEKISFKNNGVILHYNNTKIFTKKLSICVGNLSLIKLLYNSKLINSSDKISFFDGNVSYGFNFFLNKKKNYYIPMTFLEIIEKLIKGKKIKYIKEIKNTLFVQKFSKKNKKYTYYADALLLSKKKYVRFFISHHATNLSINNIPINTFIKKYSNNIKIYNSGAIRKYYPGPISQNLIYNAVII